MKVNDKWSKILTLIAGAGTLVLSYSTVYNNHVISGALLMAGFYYLLKIKQKVKYAAIAGFLMSLAGSIDVTTFLFIPLALIIIFRKENIKLKITFILATIPIIIIFLLINIYTSGSVIPPVINGALHDYPGSQLDKNTMCGLATHSSIQDLLLYSFHMVLGNRGLLSYTPLLLFSIYALIVIFRKKLKYTKYYLYIALSSLAFILFYILRTTNYSGDSFGIRWFATIMFLCLLPVGEIAKNIEKSKPKKILFILLASLSIIIALIGTVAPFTDISLGPNSLIDCIIILAKKNIIYKIKILIAFIAIFYLFYRLWKKQ